MKFDIECDVDSILLNGYNIEICEVLMRNLLSKQLLSTYKLHRYAEGIDACRKMIALHPKDAKAWHNLGLGLAYTRHYQESIKCYQNAIDLKPDFLYETYMNQSYPLLISGNMKRGLKCYEYRLDKHHTIPLIKTNKQTQLWKGESIVGKTLLVHHDGGFGDTFQFIRFIPYLKTLGCNILLFLQPELNCLFEHLNVPLIKDPLLIYDYDVHVFMVSLPYCFNTELNTIPPPIYLPSTLRPIEKRIGIAWNPGEKNGRELELTQLLPILKIPGYHFVCVQKEITLEEKELLKAYNIAQPKIESFLDTVKILEECEQIISIDSSVAHLSCSMGIPTYILLDYIACWRWLMDREDSPWYPSAKLFRQNQINVWEDPIQALALELAQSA
jgi:tetratricopeptide (TPR) repeat protein